jgi:DNA-directed RNA polymerase subunit RPC12/RpoP
MFKRAFDNILDKPASKPELYPYIYSLSFKGLKKEVKKIVNIKPIICSQCGAILTDVNLIQEDQKIGTYYKCKYCGTVNVIKKLELTESFPNEVDFLIENAPSKEEESTKGTIVKKAQGDLYISVIDISGSMSGAKIEVVKKSLIQTIKDFKINSPKTKFILVAFESYVYYYLKYDMDPIVFEGDLLFSMTQMKRVLQNKIEKKPDIGSIGEFADGWVNKINELHSMDMTALGPALFLAVISFDLFQFTSSSGRITLLTDGLANEGIGNLSGTSIGAKDFYDKMAELCNQKNIIVDVVGVSIPGDNNEMGLQILGKLTDHTGGKLYLISSDEMEAIFTELRHMNFIGKDVKIKVITPSPIKLKKVTGAFSSEDVKKSEINIGAVTEDRELFVEFEAIPKELSENTVDSIPVQFQVEYKDNEGRRKLRVFDDQIKITDNEENFKATYDQRLNAIFNIQSSGTQDYSGKREKSKSQLQDLKRNILEEINTIKASDANFVGTKFMESVSFLDDELEEMELEEEMAQKAPKASYFASVGQARTRMSQDKIFKRLQKKGKYKENK